MANALPAEMTVIEVREPGGPEALVPARRPLPAPCVDASLDASSFLGWVWTMRSGAVVCPASLAAS